MDINVSSHKEFSPSGKNISSQEFYCLHYLDVLLAVDASLFRYTLISPDITPVPGSIGAIKGVVAFQGEVVPVMDFDDLFFDTPDVSTQTPVNEVLIFEVRFKGFVGILTKREVDVLPAPAISPELGQTHAVGDHELNLLTDKGFSAAGARLISQSFRFPLPQSVGEVFVINMERLMELEKCYV